MSKWNLDPEVVYISGGSIEVYPADFQRMKRAADGSVTVSDPVHSQAGVRVFLHGEDGFFAFSLSPAEVCALAASVDRHCPDADPADVAVTGAV